MENLEIKQRIEQNEKERKAAEENIESLEQLVGETGILSYNPECVRKKSNWGKGSNIYKFDDEAFEPEIFLKTMPDSSPKLNALMKKIADLDKQDMKKQGKLFKHFIFSDLKSGTYGAKLIASAFMAKGYQLGYQALSKNKGKEQEEEKEEEENILIDGGAKKGKKGKKGQQDFTSSYKEVMVYAKFCPFTGKPLYKDSITTTCK